MHTLDQQRGEHLDQPDDSAFGTEWIDESDVALWALDDVIDVPETSPAIGSVDHEIVSRLSREISPSID